MATENRRKFLINFAYFTVILMLAFVALRYFIPMTSPFVIGFLIAYALKRPIRFVRKNLRLPGKVAAIVVVLLFYATVGMLLTMLGLRGLSAMAALVGEIPQIYYTHIYPFFEEILNNLEVILANMDVSLVAIMESVGEQFFQTMGKMVSDLSVFVMAFASGTASALPSVFIKIVLMVISSFFIAMDYERLTGFCMRQLGERGGNIFFQIKEYIVGTLWVCIRSYLIIMSLTFVELSIGLSIIGVRHAVLVAFLISIFDILPVLGTGGIMLPWAALTAVKGDFTLALALLVVYLVITVIRNIIEPKIVGSQLGLHPVVTLVSMFVGVQLFGVMGLFGFPILLSLLCYLDENGVIQIWK